MWLNKDLLLSLLSLTDTLHVFDLLIESAKQLLTTLNLCLLFLKLSISQLKLLLHFVKVFSHLKYLCWRRSACLSFIDLEKVCDLLIFLQRALLSICSLYQKSTPSRGSLQCAFESLQICWLKCWQVRSWLLAMLTQLWRDVTVRGCVDDLWL